MSKANGTCKDPRKLRNERNNSTPYYCRACKKEEKARKQSMVRHPQVDNQETTISPTGEIVDDRTSSEREKRRCHLYLVEPMQKEDPKPKNTISTRGQIIKTDPEKTEDKQVNPYFSRAGEQVTANLVEDRGSLSRLRAGIGFGRAHKISRGFDSMLRRRRSAPFGIRTLAAAIKASG